MLEQTFPCRERCEQIWIMHLLHITLVVKILNEFVQLDGAHHF